MAATTVTPYQSVEAALATTFTAYHWTEGIRNVVVCCESNFYVGFGQSDLDGVATSTSNRQLFTAGTYSIRAPKSGCGDQTPDRDAGAYIAFAYVSATPTFGVTFLPENVST